MKIAVVSDWFSARMGYAENFLPKALGRLGHDVHLLTSDLQVYATSPDYDRIYRSKLGDRQVPPGVFAADGFTLHRMPSRPGRLGIHISDLPDRLRQLAPDVVYCFEINCPTTVQVARLRRRLGYRVFCESRLHASVFRQPVGWMARARWNLKNHLLGLSDVVQNVDRYYPLGPDVLSIISTYLGVPKERCTLSSLAVETQIFSPAKAPQKVREFRRRVGLGESDLVCVYTGRFTPDKGPLVLATAIDALQAQGHSSIRGLFIGQGEESYVAKIASSAGCVIHPFVEPQELASIYHSADIGVWPLQESTSQLDAMACGLPIIINDSVEDPVRLGDGAVTFRKNDSEHLVARILELHDAARRADMGRKGAARILESCSWDALARRRVRDFEASPGLADNP
jgi:glycosyltransferase involved in cell wall biosynthesis